jgi:hypothetical protein
MRLSVERIRKRESFCILYQAQICTFCRARRKLMPQGRGIHRHHFHCKAPTFRTLFPLQFLSIPFLLHLLFPPSFPLSDPASLTILILPHSAAKQGTPVMFSGIDLLTVDLGSKMVSNAETSSDRMNYYSTIGEDPFAG